MKEKGGLPMKEIKLQKTKNTDAQLSKEQADKLLGQIMSDLELEESSEYPRSSYRSFVLRRYIIKKAAGLAAAAAILLGLLPGIVLPASATVVSAAVLEDGSRAHVEFRVNCLIPAQHIKASINQKVLDVSQAGYQKYSVDVEENGYLLFEVTSASGIKSTQSISIEELDEEPPHITKHYKSGGKITIYLTDGDGSGVDYDNISAYLPETRETIKPYYSNEEKGYTVLPYPGLDMYITIPDNNGNETTALLQPNASDD